MTAARTFYSRLNPVTRLALALSLIALAFVGPGLHLPAFVFLCMVLPLAWISGTLRPVLRLCAALVLPAALALLVAQGLFYPGNEVIVAWGGLALKWEGVRFAYATSCRLLVMTGGFTLLLQSTSPGELMPALTAKGMPSQLAYVIVASLQLVPETQARAQAIGDAQRSRGLQTSGSLFRRMNGLLPLIGPLVVGSVLASEERALALEARAFNSGRPTAWHSFSDKNAERALRWGCLALVLLAGVSRIWLH